MSGRSHRDCLLGVYNLVHCESYCVVSLSASFRWVLLLRRFWIVVVVRRIEARNQVSVCL